MEFKAYFVQIVHSVQKLKKSFHFCSLENFSNHKPFVVKIVVEIATNISTLYHYTQDKVYMT